MPDDDRTEELLGQWGRDERARRAAEETEAWIAAGLALQAGRRRRRRLGLALAGLGLFGFGLLAGRMTMERDAQAPRDVVSGAPAVAPGDTGGGAAAPSAAADRAWPEALRLELAAYEHTGERRRSSYARAADAWLEEADVLGSLRCLERLDETGGPPPPGDPLWNNWLFVALQGDAD